MWIGKLFLVNRVWLMIVHPVVVIYISCSFSHCRLNDDFCLCFGHTAEYLSCHLTEFMEVIRLIVVYYFAIVMVSRVPCCCSMFAHIKSTRSVFLHKPKCLSLCVCVSVDGILNSVECKWHNGVRNDYVKQKRKTTKNEYMHVTCMYRHIIRFYNFQLFDAMMCG